VGFLEKQLKILIDFINKWSIIKNGGNMFWILWVLAFVSGIGLGWMVARKTPPRHFCVHCDKQFKWEDYG
jgi:D-alanyl-lipoteichoic acid acyltransferase DltB (MBOAT superfamily)